MHPRFRHDTPIRMPLTTRFPVDWWFVGDMLEATFSDMNITSVRQYLLGQDALNDLRLLTGPNLHLSAKTSYGSGSLGSELPSMIMEQMWMKTMELGDDYDLGLTIVRFSGIGAVEQHFKSSFVSGRTVLNKRTRTLVR